MATREIVRIKNGWTVVSSREGEASYRYRNRRLAEAQVAAWERAEAAGIALRAEDRANRLHWVREYLAERAKRPAAAQLAFDFTPLGGLL